jgi:ADP-ribose pyrophosphatase YjhB (NUDIX family)
MRFPQAASLIRQGNFKKMARDALRQALEPAIRRVLHVYWRFARGMTFGVRAVVIDPAGRVLLVKHSYVSGWHLPGGGVEVGETAEDALGRELVEEAGVTAREAALFGLYFNARISRRDHVALYVVRDFVKDGGPRHPREIIDHGFFAPDTLPEGTTRGTQARLDEVLKGVPRAHRW